MRLSKSVEEIGHPAKLDWIGWLIQYIEKHRRAQGRAEKTRDLDQLQLERLTLWAAPKGLLLQEFTADQAGQYVSSLDSTLSPRGVNMALQVARSFGDYLVSKGVWPVNHFRAPGIAKRREVKNRLPRGLTPDELSALLATPKRHLSHGLRDYCMLYLMGFVGLRSGEVCNLKESDLHLDSCRVRVAGETAKTRQERFVWLPHTKKGTKRVLKEEFDKPLRDWLLIRKTMGLGKDAPLFCVVSRHDDHAPQGSPLTPRAVLQRTVRYGKRAKIGRRVHPHMLRHTAGYLMGKRGMTVEQIMQELGHVSVSMALHYSKGTSEDTGDAYAEADVSGIVAVPTRKRPKV
jgi:site-specific recombinase XerD